MAESIAEESKEASIIKKKMPIMVVLGNPPYSVSSSNKGDWITELIKVYKKNLDERNIQPLSDDYIKFIRYAEHFIEKNGNGVVAMITNNSFLDGNIHRQMRKHLLETFDKIYILDLHGNYKKKESNPEGGKDENVFNIQQGVSINIFVRKEAAKKDLCEVYHADLYGTRKNKFEHLNKSSISSIKWHKLEYSDPFNFFVPKDFKSVGEYEKGFKVDELFQIKNAGTATGKDSLFVKMSSDELITSLRTGVTGFIDEELIVDYLYRPFDLRKTVYDNKLIQRLRKNVMDHMLKDNVALLVTSKNRQLSLGYVFVSKCVSDRHLLDSAADSMYVFPLYLYHQDGTRTINFNNEYVNKIEEVVGSVQPEDIFNYIYAVLHSLNYREKYKEFLKIDFPKIPYPPDKKTYRKLIKLGNDLRMLHLLEPQKINDLVTTYPESGSDTVEVIEFKDANVYINENQYFGNVPEAAWEFWIGGYQPAKKWLKDRKGQTLTNEDLEHYQKMIVSIIGTYQIMKEIDKELRV